MAYRDHAAYGEDKYGASGDAPQRRQQVYQIDDDSVRSNRWDIREWRKRTWALLAAALVIIIVVVVVAVVEVKKKNRYPNYMPLNYHIVDTYGGTNFFDNFEYFWDYDPAGGWVHYVSDASYNLTIASETSAIIKVDTTVANASTGRWSVRLQSKKQYATGLFIFDVLHTPIGCGTWPALWLSDPANWPANGEIDIMEAVNVVSNAQNQVTLHTAPGCSMGVKRKETGKSVSTSCVNTTDSNAGCGVDAGTDTFGSIFNSKGGGIAAMELRNEGIRVWQFPRSSIPGDITSGNPDPSTWGEATADFPNTDCDIGTHFRNQSIIANIDLCGSWAGAANVFGESCPGTCKDYVTYNNTAFSQSFWEFGKFSIYQA